MSVDVFMPKFGMTMQEGTIVSWLKQPGDPVEKDEPLVEIMSDKITNVLEAPASGVLKEIIVNEGETAAIGTKIGVIQETEKTAHKVQQSKPDEAPDHQEENKIAKEIRPLSSLRKVIGKRMRESLTNIPQGTLTTRADMTELIKLKDEYKSKDDNIAFTSLFVKMICAALDDNPLLNSTIQDEKLIIYESKNIGVAVAVEDGLYVPVIKNAQNKNVFEIAQELKALTKKIKDGTITGEEMKDGTFTISNVGMFDVEVITPIINPPESAILAIGATKDEIVPDKDGKPQVKPLVTFSLTVDHAVMDALPAVKFLETIKNIMKNPKEFIQ